MRWLRNLFSRRSSEMPSVAPDLRDTVGLLALPIAQMRIVAAQEAIQSLGLLKFAALDIVVAHLDPDSGQHPRATGTHYRKQGEQLSATEKRELGIRSNASLSRKAFTELTEKGMEKPLVAHETTFLRATFTMIRHRDLSQFQRLGRKSIRELRYDMLHPVCSVCAELDGKSVTVSSAHLLPPTGCRCETANYGIRAEIDWLSDID